MSIPRVLLLSVSWPSLLACLIALCGLSPLPARAQDAQLNRCAGPGGNTIYTDRPCESIGAVSRLPRGAASGNIGTRRSGCARTLQELVYDITNAIDTRDVNRLGAVYHWVGHSPESGYRILDQLQAIVDRPLVDIVPLRAAARTEPADTGTTAPATPASQAVPVPVVDDPASTPQVSVDSQESQPAETPAPRPIARRTPVGLRLEQTLKNGSTPSRTIFGLRRHLDCWWITF
jgi:hypothetical protein